MRLSYIRSTCDPYYQPACDVYVTAFRAEQRAPVDDLVDLVKRGIGHAIAFVDESDGREEFIGASYIVPTPQYLWILFLAMTPASRGQGYGTRALEMLAAEFPQRALLLEIEAVLSEARNADQRQRRERFYLRNGFSYTGLSTDEPDGRFDFLIRDGEIDLDQMREVMESTVGTAMLDRWQMVLIQQPGAERECAGENDPKNHEDLMLDNDCRAADRAVGDESRRADSNDKNPEFSDRDDDSSERAWHD
ncbi:GNAT family N-acetyltransferase [Trueperella sp. LYQ141]|uniref:GNAT family N-acetyltransferase n=1 Tax=Trueperella sp. LYQ141 TaxID=3391058 RepID=UPI0039835365